jgi:hypothetical protein
VTWRGFLTNGRIFIHPGWFRALTVAVVIAMCTLGGYMAGRGFRPEKGRSSLPLSALPGKLRLTLLEALAASTRVGNFFEAARLNSYLAHEAFLESKKVLDFWMQRQDPETKLFVTHSSSYGNGWVYEDTASDLYPFLVIAAYLLDREQLPALQGTLMSERALSAGALPKSALTSKGEPLSGTIEERIFGSVEYMKDGLLSISELMGRNDWFNRMEELTRVVFDVAPVKTAFGPIPSQGTEKNGEILQVLSRLYWATRTPAYLTWAETIGDAYVNEVLPSSDYLPSDIWNFDSHSSPHFRSYFRLRDHGNEIVGGLVELYVIEACQHRDRREIYHKAIKAMLDRLLIVGRNTDGLWYKQLRLPAAVPSSERLTDNWGYLYNSYYTFSLATKNCESDRLPSFSLYEEEVGKTLKNLPKYSQYPWAGVPFDGYADSLEGALYLLNHMPLEEGFSWLDGEVATMFALFRGNEGSNLDGNLIRTALLYALYKTQGTYVQPWQPGIMVGAYRHEGTLYLHIETTTPWKGKLFFDRPRHKEFWKLPFDYPRLNSWPEWFVVESDHMYRTTSNEPSLVRTWDGNHLLQKGIDLELMPAKPLDLAIAAAES